MGRAQTLLTADHPEWERLEAEKRAALRRPAATPVEDLLRAGQRLSAQAAALRRGLRDGRRAAGS